MDRSLLRTLLISGAGVALMATAGACSCSVGSSSHAVSKDDVAGQLTGGSNKYGVNVTVTSTDGDNYHMDFKVDDQPS
jgi:hypothetical protein